MCGDQNVLRAFQLDKHPAVQNKVDTLRANGTRISGYVLHGIVRSVFYRSDLPTMFDPLMDLSDAIKASRAAFKMELDGRLDNPLSEAMASDAPDIVKADGGKTHYAWDHSKAI